jgi:hypothetical protein
MNAPMFGVYNSQGGVQLAPDTADPFDSSNFPAAQYPYAFETFGNNGSVPRGSAVTSSSNHSLDDLTNTVPNAATVYADIKLTGSGSTFTGSDHYPVVGDYNLVPPPSTTPVIGALVMTNNQIQFTITGMAGGNYAVQVSTNLSTTNWLPILTNQSPFTYTDTNTQPLRFYRAKFVP